jgi:hypothetical protein
MLRRLALLLVKERLESSPAAALIGPRQSGKTTAAKSLSPHYFDLEQPEDRLRLDLRWDEISRPAAKPWVFDEAQSWPEVFPRLRAAIDRHPRRNGRFLLLGSVSPALMCQVSESLAGRLSLVELTPFLAIEMTPDRDNDLWLRGGFPRGGILGGRTFPQWQKDYLSLLAQRDLPAWGLPAKPAMTDRMFRMTAALNGQVWNASEVGRALGLSYHTVNASMEFLTGAFLLRFLAPFHANLKKRLIKSPKMYWRDTGLLHSLLGVSSQDELLSRPWVGASWEGFVIEQILGYLSARGESHNAFYLRTSDGSEIDLILERGDRRWAVEIKLTTSPAPEDARKLKSQAEAIGARPVLLSRVSRTDEGSGILSTNLRGFLSRLRDDSKA